MGQVVAASQGKRDAARAKRAASGAGDGWRGFVNVDLSAADKERIREGDVGYSDAWAFLMQRCLDGYKLSVTYDHGGAAWVASLTCKRSSDANVGLCLTARGGRVEGAVLALWYKDDVLLGGAWSGRFEQRGARLGEDDLG